MTKEEFWEKWGPEGWCEYMPRDGELEKDKQEMFADLDKLLKKKYYYEEYNKSFVQMGELAHFNGNGKLIGYGLTGDA